MTKNEHINYLISQLAGSNNRLYSYNSELEQAETAELSFSMCDKILAELQAVSMLLEDASLLGHESTSVPSQDFRDQLSALKGNIKRFQSSVKNAALIINQYVKKQATYEKRDQAYRLHMQL